MSGVRAQAVNFWARHDKVALRRLSKRFVHFLFKGKQFYYTRPLKHALEMRRYVGKRPNIHIQLSRAAATPEEMCVWCRKVFEKVFTPREHFVGNRPVFIESLGGKLDHTFGCACRIADLGRIVDTAQVGMNAAGTPSMKRYCLTLL